MEKFVIEKIQVTNFTCYRDLELSLPAEGVTLVLGSNGAGKSTLVECVAWCMYGKTLRKNLMPEVGAEVTLTLAGGTKVTRKRVMKAYLLQVTTVNGDVSGQTTTETQNRLDDMFGPWERFSATRMFGREFTSKFGSATDKERKALLEELLGLDRFNVALAMAREKLKTAETRAVGAGVRVSVGTEAIERQKGLLESLPDDGEMHRVQMALNDAETDLAFRVKALKESREAVVMVDDLKTDLVQRRGAAESTKGGAARALAEATAKYTRLASLTDCPVCLQPVDKGAHERIATHFTGQIGPLEVTRDKAAADLADATSQLEEVLNDRQQLNAQAESLQVRVGAAQAAAGQLRGQLDQIARQVDARERAAGDLAKLQDQVAQAQITRDFETREQQILTVAVQAFGLQGARVLLMAQALATLEDAANDILTRLGLGIAVKLGTTTMKMSGKVHDELSVTLVGAGGGAYDSASSGERARVDVALMMGLAALQGSMGWGFLAYDEVFDTLDDEGIERVATFLAELGETQQVVVIAHNPELKALMPRGRVLVAQRGAVQSTLGPQ